MQTARIIYGLLVPLLAACSSDAVDGADGADDAFTFDGKGDDTGLSKRETDAVLRVANRLTLEKLDDEVSLDARAARAIYRYRTGADGVAGTRDDRRFWTLDELDRVRYVGPVAFEKLTEFARNHDPDPTGASTLYFRAEETNLGSDVFERDTTEPTPSPRFGAVIERSKLRLIAEGTEYSLDVLATTTASARLGGWIDVGSPAISPRLTIEGNTFHWGGGGVVDVGCPSLGGAALASLYQVSLQDNGNSVKLINGNMRLQVVADDGSLFCTGE